MCLPGRGSVRLALGVMLLAAATSGPAHGQDEWLPRGLLFAPVTAGQNEALNYVSFVHASSEGESITGGFVGLGAQFPLYRQSRSPDSAWQVDLFGAIQSQFNMDAETSYALINSDYLVGLPVSSRTGRRAWRARLFHQSSHLGDELILSLAAPPRKNISFEAVDFLLAYDLKGGWRPYGGFTALLSSKEDIGYGAIQAGSEWRGANRFLGGRLAAAIDMVASDARNWRAQTKIMAGMEFGTSEPGAPNLGIYLEAFHGPAPFGQFYTSDITFAGLVAHFDLN